MAKKISLTMDLLISVIAFIDGISLGVTENPLVNRKDHYFLYSCILSVLIF